MSASQDVSVSVESGGPVQAAERQLRVLLYSDNRTTRDGVRIACGKRPGRGVEIVSWLECATPAAAYTAMQTATFDLLILDGESAPLGGLGMCRQFKHEFFNCPPVIVLTGRPQDDWLAAWSYADAAVPHPADPMVLARAVVDTSAAAAVIPS